MGDNMSDKKMVIGKDTLVPLGMVLAICSGVVWMISQLDSIHYKLKTIDEKMINHWTTQNMENWGLKLKMLNPNLTIPDPPKED
tara:strand:- start:807 stop:1058 length:252 start_codon:yes stop_codon:yes gene_type:complete